MHGLEGPLEGKTYPAGIMVGNEEQSDEWIAAIVSYIRTNLSNEGTLVTADDVKKVRDKTTGKDAPYTYEELVHSVPQILIPNEGWKITASHSVPTRIGGRASPNSAFNFEGWSTGGNQEKDMWYQIEFPEIMNISELHYNATPISRGWRPDAPPPLHTYPRGYIPETSTDGNSWKEIKNGKGEQADVSLVFEPIETKFVRMKLTENFGSQEDHEIPWSMRQMKIYGYVK
ncbi:discoidin domain-containing protein [Maribacter litopenaei]|uniref:Discoidin domain-containing protein n=1 Tax=Maribacter litopenaei TaxID=2976127 RepID=A0ABY5Y917_9FLAO|nr:discoidin domain-containing protein [Maribacter litopenaei]UWX55384.1 discoidin domain-containing protein [Maribacter litopenaei]